ncbi:hypothetical protein [Bordetella hinzii]|uniref:N-acetyltransferase YedL n=1 Tax=Bordetella hinzii OH87 BAL007II TaxID=1331262 RepID=A0ABR4R4U0_9BORD|nr:hypothetical protein [Bordetella hinzii]KCB25948.1 hypothetical protein L544_3231 [Bordetella hinzii OH87 BAL007II]
MVDFASQLQLPDYSRLAGGVQGLIGLQGNLLQQQQLQQQMDANIAASEAMKRATDPVTGKLDQSKFAALMSQGPGAYNLPTYLKNATELENLQLDTQAKRFDLQQKQLGFWNGQLGALMSKGPNVSTQDVLKSLSDGMQLGMITPGQAQQYADAIPSSPDERAEWIKQHWIGLQSAKDQAQFMMPNVQMVDTGSSMNVVPLDPLTGAPKGAVTAFQKGLTPEAAAQRINVFNPQTGQQGTTSLGSTVGGMPGTAQGGGFLPTSAAMGQGRIADAAADRYNALTEAAGNAPTAINGYKRALEALDKGGMAGPAANSAIRIPAILQSLGLQDEGDVVKNTITLQKYLSNAASKAAQSAGYSGSDARVAMFSSGQPDPEKMTPAALRDAVQYVMALESGVMAKNNAAQAWLEQHGGNTAKLPEFERRWSNAFNPDVMELRNMAPEQQRAYIAGLSEAKRKSLMESYRKMSEVGAF